MFMIYSKLVDLVNVAHKHFVTLLMICFYFKLIKRRFYKVVHSLNEKRVQLILLSHHLLLSECTFCSIAI